MHTSRAQASRKLSRPPKTWSRQERRKFVKGRLSIRATIRVITTPAFVLMIRVMEKACIFHARKNNVLRVFRGLGRAGNIVVPIAIIQNSVAG
ncbi:hypothetical protein H112_00020 [Trichophyton rubrum D6]|uniref:Uncharacterized protein n=2 Tax=Trichophyton TaxID=5550 RepID=A0A022WHI0_TRIRU|nr:hypothetical protein H100_00019 [Trichophyton rubrum MR850]EZF47131.1 hypothetical protein H102_00019 [Trichophyton rubrum CBS 100081]EZF57784.1 hypothetical protein H103_00019 [Trichophyton rubrum CBS 288.86]EZF68382.1 hypothetical protein H104_00018 [Trichophyton rubrum CBS 289.86]EZF79051.1 hypothetical protein H105_00019 [Trichophyton soudanense CBS 452.61]EZF89695.1 hypothetical protein H110_00019 [Trichophyton rubrum MR1448]EZG00509.1 hypothetical protein H113_00021 [Trichophyton rub